MAVDTRFQLSRLESLAEYLVRGTDIDSGLVDVLEEGLPKKGREKLIQQVDKLLQEPAGTRAMLLTLCFLLDEWLGDGGDVLQATHQAAEPFEWLATSDHLEVVRTFRALL